MRGHAKILITITVDQTDVTWKWIIWYFSKNASSEKLCISCINILENWHLKSLSNTSTQPSCFEIISQIRKCIYQCWLCKITLWFTLLSCHYYLFYVGQSESNKQPVTEDALLSERWSNQTNWIPVRICIFRSGLTWIFSLQHKRILYFLVWWSTTKDLWFMNFSICRHFSSDNEALYNTDENRFCDWNVEAYRYM